MVTAGFAVSAQDCNPATPARYFGKEIPKFVSGSGSPLGRILFLGQ
jgi:hypothetical protein